MPSDTPVQHDPIPTPHDPTMIKIHIQSCISGLRDEDGKAKSRELSLAVTKLQEAVMWIEEHQRFS